MRRVIATAALLAALCAAWSATPSVAADQAPGRAVVVLAPYLRWADLSPTATPNLWQLAESGSIGNVNSRSREREEGKPGSVVEGALTLSSGVWAYPPREAQPAMNVDETMTAGLTAAQAYARATGGTAGSASIAYVGLPAALRANEGKGFKAQPGVLGQSVTDAGGITAAVGNGDLGVVGAHMHARPAAIVAMDQDGLVALGDVSTALLRADSSAPFGVRTDLETFERATQAVPADFQGLLVLDAGDMHRAVAFAPQVAPEVAVRMRADALKALDSVVGLARERWPDTPMIVMSMSTADTLTSGPEAFGPVIFSRGDDEVSAEQGVLSSDSTQRLGLVTSLDVARTLYAQASGSSEASVGMAGSVLEAENPAWAGDLDDRVAWLSRQSAAAVAIDSVKYTIANTFVALLVLALLFSAMVVVTARGWRPRTALRWVIGLKAVLALVSVAPLAGWLMFVPDRWPAGMVAVTLGFLGALGVTWIAALFALRRWPSRAVLGVTALLSALVICVDQWLGAPLSFSNFFGYSPIVAARFYGIGNEAASILFGAALVGVALILDQWPDRPWSAPLKRFGIPAIGIVVVLSAAAPFWGANVGVAIWGVVGFGLMYLLMNEIPVTWKSVVALGFVVVAVIGAFAVLDRLGGAQTHLARSLSAADQGGIQVLVDIVVRKAQTNLRVLTATNWAYILVAVLAYLGFMRWRPHGEFADTLAANPRFADAVTVSLVAGAVAYFTEDSGIVIPALITFWIGVGIAWLMLDRLAEDVSGEDRR